MEFTKVLRRYFAINRGKLIECAMLYKESFPQVSYKSFTKLIDRFAKDGTLEPVARGVYLVKDVVPINLEEAIKDAYIGSGEGMTIGYDLYRRCGINVSEAGSLKILTNATAFTEKRVGDCIVCGCGIIFFGPGEKRMVELLEILSHSRTLAFNDSIGFDKTLPRTWQKPIAISHSNQ